LEAIIIRITPYKEDDAIINALTSDGFLTFQAKGIKKPKAKLASVLVVGNIVDVELISIKAGYLVVGAKSLVDLAPIFSNFTYLTSLNFLGEISKNTLVRKEEVIHIYPYLKEAIINLTKNDDPLVINTLFLIRLMSVIGYEFKFSSCNTCGSTKDLMFFDYFSGGITCKNCKSRNSLRLQSETIQFINENLKSYKSSELNDDIKADIKALFVRLLYFLIDNIDLKLQSLPFLQLCFDF
jgi:DNA repair protein RecO